MLPSEFAHSISSIKVPLNLSPPGKYGSGPVFKFPRPLTKELLGAAGKRPHRKLAVKGGELGVGGYLLVRSQRLDSLDMPVHFFDALCSRALWPGELQRLPTSRPRRTTYPFKASFFGAGRIQKPHLSVGPFSVPCGLSGYATLPGPSRDDSPSHCSGKIRTKPDIKLSHDDITVRKQALSKLTSAKPKWSASALQIFDNTASCSGVGLVPSTLCHTIEHSQFIRQRHRARRVCLCCREELGMHCALSPRLRRSFGNPAKHFLPRRPSTSHSVS
jgi:hypothetical protein